MKRPIGEEETGEGEGKLEKEKKRERKGGEGYFVQETFMSPNLINMHWHLDDLLL